MDTLHGQAKMVASLPIYVRTWIQRDLKRDLHEITSFEFGAGDKLSVMQFHRYRINFSDGRFDFMGFQVFTDESTRGEVYISGFHERDPPNLWIHQHIMEQPNSKPWEVGRYQETLAAYLLISHLVKRGGADPLLRRVAQKLVQDESAEEAPAMALQVGCFANAYTASQICTAAYQAWHELERERFVQEFESTGQELSDDQ